MALSKSNLSFTNDNQNCFTTYYLANLALALNSALGQTLPVFSSKDALVFFPFRCSDRGEVWTLVLRSPDPGAGAETSPAIATETLSRGDTCRRVSHAHDDNKGAR